MLVLFCVPRQDSDGSHPEHESHSHSSVSSIPLSNLSTPMEMDALLDGRNWGWLVGGLVENYICANIIPSTTLNKQRKGNMKVTNAQFIQKWLEQYPISNIKICRLGQGWSPGWATGRPRSRRRGRRGTCGVGPRKRRPRRPDWWIAGEAQTVVISCR